MRYLLSLIGLLFTFVFFSGFRVPGIKNTAPILKTHVVHNRQADYLAELYTRAGLAEAGLDKAILQQALAGYGHIKTVDAPRLTMPILTVIDFTKNSTEKRLWVIDLLHQKLLYHTLVAHGKNTGEQYAEHFSNNDESNMSSLGFYLTAEIYNGKHGESLALDGLEQGFNDHARARSIVMHAADYVSEDFIQKVGRLGRSQGCPAVPPQWAPKIINAIAGGSCLFIYYPDKNYEKNSKFLTSNSSSLISQR